MSTSPVDMTEQSRPQSLVIDTRFVGGRSTRIVTDLPVDEDFNVAKLIVFKVSAEWHAGVPVAEESVFPEDIDGNKPFAWPSLEDAVRASLDAFRAGWYVILIDGMPANGLDQRLSITSETGISFVRGCPTPAGKS